GEAGRQESAVGQVVHRGEQLLAGEVAGDPEDHQTARSGDPRQAAVPRVAQRVGVRGDRSWGHRPPSLPANPSETVLISSAQLTSNFWTPSSSSSVVTSSRSTPTAARRSSSAADCTYVPVTESPVIEPWSATASSV